MPHLVQMDKKYGKKGLQIIGVHRQQATTEEIVKVAEKQKVKFPIVDNGSSPVAIKGIPHAFVFSAAGKLVYSGYPGDDFDKAIKKELKNVKLADAGDKDDFFAPRKPKADGPLVPQRTWTNTDGKKLKAALLSVDGDKGKFLRSTGSTFSYDITKLSEEDQKLIKEKSGGGEEKEADGGAADDDPFK